MNITDFAVFGARPAFARPLPIGQLYFPAWERYETAMRGIFERQYYTNQGPLAEQLEARLQEFLGVKHAICVTNATIGLIMAAEALGLTGKVILPAFTFIASAQSLSWCGLQPVFCDIDPASQQLDAGQVAALIDQDVSGILGVNLWGGACNPTALAALARQHGLHLYFDSAHAFGCRVNNVAVGNFGEMEVFSFHATKILSATEGGCICTNDDHLAAHLRNIRSSYGAGHPVEVIRTSNGRMSEAQAAIALLSLEDFPANRAHNETLFRAYAQHLASLPGLDLLRPTGVSYSNYQYLVCQVDALAFGLSRDQLLAVVKAENLNARRYFYPGLHRSVPYAEQFPQYQHRLPNTDHICATSIQFPIGAQVSVDSVERIGSLLSRIHRHAVQIRERLAVQVS